MLLTADVSSRTKAIKNEKNSLQITTAHMAQMYFNSNRAEDTQPLESPVNLLPFPSMATRHSSIFNTLDSREAKEILSVWRNLPFHCQQSIEAYKTEIIQIAHDD